jgi:uncharacterized protein (TIGR03437 family)
LVYISDFGTGRVYRAGADGVLRLLAGAGELKDPAGLAVDATGAVYIADSGNHRVVKWVNGQIKTVLEDFGMVTSIAVDRMGRMYAAGGDRIAVVSPTGELSFINLAADEVALDANGRILTVAYKQVRSTFAGVTTILAGSRQGIYAGDGGPPEEWRFHRPTGLARDEAGDLYIADSGNGRVRKISVDGQLSTMAVLGSPAYFAFDFNNVLYVSDSKSGEIYKADPLGKLQLFTKGSGAKPFRNPAGLGFDNRGDLFVADTGNGLIRKVTPDGIVSIVAGGGSSEDDGFGLGLALKSPVGIGVVPDGTVWFTETGRLRKLSREGRITTVLSSPLVDPRGLRIEPDGSILVADAGTHRVLRIEPDGRWKVLAGGGEAGYTDRLLNGVTDILPERDGTFLVADSLNSRIRRLTPTTEAAPIGVAPLRILHAATGHADPIAPGQIAFVESDAPFPTGELRVLFGSLRADIISTESNRIKIIVPPSPSDTSTEIIIADTAGPWAVTELKLAAAAPAVIGAISNEDGAANSLEKPAARLSAVTIPLTGEGTAVAPNIVVTIGRVEAEVLATSRKFGQMSLIVRVPGGFLPSGVLPLDVRIDGVKLLQEKTIVCR